MSILAWSRSEPANSDLFQKARTNFVGSARRHLVRYLDDNTLAHVLSKCRTQRTQELGQCNKYQTLVAVRDAPTFEARVKFPGESIRRLVVQ